MLKWLSLTEPELGQLNSSAAFCRTHSATSTTALTWGREFFWLWKESVITSEHQWALDSGRKSEHLGETPHRHWEKAHTLSLKGLEPSGNQAINHLVYLIETSRC